MSTSVSIIREVLALNPAAFDLPSGPQSLSLAVSIVIFAGLSEALGQSVVLFANRVPPKRFLVSLFLAAGLYTFGFIFWTLSVWVVATTVFGVEAGLSTVMQAMGLGYAPYLFGFLILAPYFGQGISIVLSLWSLLAIMLALKVTLALTLLQALLCAALGWLLLHFIRRTLGRPLEGVVSWLRRRIAGVPVVVNREELRDLVSGEALDLEPWKNAYEPR